MLIERTRKRKRTKQEFALKIRLERAANASREAARIACSPAERDALLKRARRFEITAHLDEWLSSPGLFPPK
jgi:hypothetical protein